MIRSRFCILARKTTEVTWCPLLFVQGYGVIILITKNSLCSREGSLPRSRNCKSRGGSGAECGVQAAFPLSP